MAPKILIAARRELAEGIQGKDMPVNPRPELFKILLLALGAGLRRDEIDRLQWKQIQYCFETELVLFLRRTRRLAALQNPDRLTPQIRKITPASDVPAAAPSSGDGEASL